MGVIDLGTASPTPACSSLENSAKKTQHDNKQQEQKDELDDSEPRFTKSHGRYDLTYDHVENPENDYCDDQMNEQRYHDVLSSVCGRLHQGNAGTGLGVQLLKRLPSHLFAQSHDLVDQVILHGAGFIKQVLRQMDDFLNQRAREHLGPHLEALLGDENLPVHRET